MKKNIIIVRGGGDIATGTIYKLHQSGYPVLVTEIANPSAIRRQVAFSEAVYEKSYTVEGVTCYFAENLTRAYELLKQRKVALMIDPGRSGDPGGETGGSGRRNPCKEKSWDYNGYGTVYGCIRSRIYGGGGRACGC